eukprot:4274052-Alexandrium_andersonii.AAC.1
MVGFNDLLRPSHNLGRLVGKEHCHVPTDDLSVSGVALLIQPWPCGYGPWGDLKALNRTLALERFVRHVSQFL